MPHPIPTDRMVALTGRCPNEDIKLVLERLVDVHGARLVAENLVEVYYDKAEHINGVWHDQKRASVWRKVATRLGKAIHWTNLEWPS